LKEVVMQKGPEKTVVQEWWYNTIAPWWYGTIVPWWNSLDWSDHRTWLNAGMVVLSAILWVALFYLIFRIRKQVHTNRELQKQAAISLKQAVFVQQRAREKIAISKPVEPDVDTTILKLVVDAFIKTTTDADANMERVYTAALERTEDANRAVARAYDLAMERLEEVHKVAAERMQEQCEQTINAILKSQKRALAVVRDAMKVLEGATPDKVYEMTQELQELNKSHDGVLDQLKDLEKAVARPSPKDVDDEDDED
jgi:hypothetical protein